MAPKSLEVSWADVMSIACAGLAGAGLNLAVLAYCRKRWLTRLGDLLSRSPNFDPMGIRNMRGGVFGAVFSRRSLLAMHAVGTMSLSGLALSIVLLWALDRQLAFASLAVAIEQPITWVSAAVVARRAFPDRQQ